MKILVTGGAGFIGSAVVRMAINKGHKIINVDALTYAANLSNLQEIEDNPNYILEILNICDRKKLDEIFEQHKPDAVMHLAAESHVDRSIDTPATFIETNIVGTYNMLEASRKYWENYGQFESFRFHHVSTDEVFGSLPENKSVKFTETTRYDPRSPYSASKASSDHLVRAWFETFKIPIVISNCSNNYGPYHFPEKLVPLVIINALSENSLPIYGDGSNIRDWLFVEDHAEALLLILANGRVGSSYNIGGENELTNLEIVRKICAILDECRPRKNGMYEDLITFVDDRPGHDARYAIDPSHLRTEMGWRPAHNIEVGLKKTVLWYLENEDWWLPLLSRDGVGKRLGRNGENGLK